MIPKCDRINLAITGERGRYTLTVDYYQNGKLVMTDTHGEPRETYSAIRGRLEAVKGALEYLGIEVTEGEGGG